MEEGSFVILRRAAEHGVEHMILPAPSRTSGMILARAVEAGIAGDGLAASVRARAYPIMPPAGERGAGDRGAGG